MKPPVSIVTGGGGADLGGKGKCNFLQIPFDGLCCMVFETAYHFIDITADTHDADNLTLTCKVMGLGYDLTQGLPGDDDFSKQFVKKQLKVIDTIDIQWQPKKQAVQSR